MTKAAALYKFYSSFELPAFEENAVPSDPDSESVSYPDELDVHYYGGVDGEYPYLTYELITDSLGSEIPLSFSIWYRSESWKAANAKEKEISAAIGRGGKFLPCDGGAIWLKRGTLFAQRMGDDSGKDVKRIYFNISAEFITAD